MGHVAAPAEGPSVVTVSSTFWQDRPVFVTGATGLVGSWLVRRLVEAGADVVCLVRDSLPHSEFMRSGLVSKVRVVRGDLCDAPLLQRTLAEYEVRTVFHLAAQTIVGVASREPVGTLEANIRGTYLLFDACRHAKLVSEIVFASSDKAYGEHEVLPYDEDAPLQGTYPYDVSKSCADLIAKMYARAFGLPVVDHALRQLLRRRRPQLEPDRARHRPLDPARHGPDHPLGWLVHPRLLLRTRRRGGVHAAGRGAREGSEPQG